MKTIDIENWKHFEETVEEIFSRAQKLKKLNRGGVVSDLLFRGQSNANKWRLETTLDRLENNFSVEKYYKIINAIKPEIESCTRKCWKLGDINEYLTNVNNAFFAGPIRSYEFMAYLRHNFSPSPLLDWTKSPYIAAFFAYNEDKKTNCAIYTYMESTGKGKLSRRGKPKICSVPAEIRTHKRHHLQQSQYTFCIEGMNKKYTYALHEDVFNLFPNAQDIFEKYILPYSEKAIFIEKLNSMNINAYSLFENEEGLMNKLANEKLLLENL